MTDSRPGKTLRLKKSATPDDDTQKPAQRSGARARRAAILKLEREKQERLERQQAQAQKRKQRQERQARQEGQEGQGRQGRQTRRAARRPARSGGGRDMSTVYPVFAPCPQGLEEALAIELQALGYQKVRPGRAGCHFEA